MSYRTPLEYLESKLRDEHDLIVGNIIQGSLDALEYKRLCGVLQGLDLARNHIKDLTKRMEQSDE